ncbi:MAG: Calx-beta domain-containing protein [Planctomycetaceae bacterium]
MDSQNRSQSQKLTDLVTRLFSSRRSRRPARADRHSQTAYDANPNIREVRITESLEDRSLLTLIGVDFGDGIGPNQWTAVSGTADASLTGLIDETGAATAVDVDIVFSSPFTPTNVAFAPPSNQIPSHTNALANLDGAVTSQGSVELTFKDLVPGQSYEVYVFAGDQFPGDQQVTISQPLGGAIQSQFNQPHAANQLMVNDTPGDSTKNISSFARYAVADGNGQLRIRVDAEPAATGVFGLAGVALRAGAPPTSTFDISTTPADSIKLENVAATTPFTFTVTRTGDLSGPANVNYAVTGSGTNPASAADFSGPITGTLMFAAGVATQPITVNAQSDLVLEPDESFTVTLSSPTGSAGIGIGTATGQITNDDSELRISALPTDVIKAEENSGSTIYRFTVSRTGYTGATTDFLWSVTGIGVNPADAGDFVGGLTTNMSETFGIGQTDFEIDVQVSGDLDVETDEGFRVTLSDPAVPTAVIVTATANGQILNDDTGYAISPLNPSVVEGNIGTAAFTYTVTRSGNLSAGVTVPWSVSAASAGLTAADFPGNVFPSGNVVFAAGQVSEQFSFNVNGDTVAEANETFAVTLTPPVPVGLPSVLSANGNILNDDSTTLNIISSSLTHDEGDMGDPDTTFSFTIFRGGDASGTTTVDWAVVPNATNGPDAADFAGTPLTSATVTFNPNETLKVITFGVKGDDDFEPDEGFTVQLTNASSPATIGPGGTATGQITNDESRVFITTTPNDSSKAEGSTGLSNFEFTVTREGDLRGTADVPWAVTGSGTNPADVSDFGASFPSGTANFANGAATATILVPVIGDTLLEHNEGFTVTLSAPVNTVIKTGGDTAVGEIQNDDSSVFRIDPVGSVSKPEGTGGTTAFEFEVTRTGDASFAAEVDWTVTGGVDGADWSSATPNPLMFGAGVTSMTITLDVNGDMDTEADEAFTVTLSNPVNPTPGSPQPTISATNGSSSGVIQDDDFARFTITADASLPGAPANTFVAAEGNTGSTDFTFTVTRSGNTNSAVNVLYEVFGNGIHPANEPDFVGGAFPGGALFPVLFGVGDLTQPITIQVNGDTLQEENEGFTVRLHSASAGALIVADTAFGIINNDDSEVSIVATNATQDEGNTGTTPFTFTVRRTGDLSQALDVDYAVTGSGANAADAADFGGTLPSGTQAGLNPLHFDAGQATAVVTIDVSGDTDFEPDEGFTITLSNPSLTSAVITNASASGVIVNDEIVSVSLSAAPTSISETGGAATIAATLSDPAPTNITIDLSLSGTATGGGVDFDDPPLQIVIPMGGTTGFVTINAVHDLLDEPDETVVVDITNVTGAVENGTQQVTVTIQDNDAPPNVTLSATQPRLPNRLVESRPSRQHWTRSPLCPSL